MALDVKPLEHFLKRTEDKEDPCPLGQKFDHKNQMLSFEDEMAIKDVIIDEYSYSNHVFEKVKVLISENNVSQISFGITEFYIHDKKIIKPEHYPDSYKSFTFRFAITEKGHQVDTIEILICSSKNVNKIKQIYFGDE